VISLDQKVTAMEQINQALYQELSIDEFSDQALDSACRIIGGQAGSLLLVTQEPVKLEFKLSKGPHPVPIGTSLFRNLGIAGHVLLTGQPAIVLDTAKDPRHWAGIDQITGYTTKNLIATPIIGLNGEPLGVMEVVNKTTGTPNQEDVIFLQILSSFLSIAFHKAWLDRSHQREDLTHFIGDCVHDMKNMLMTIFSCKELLREEIDQLYRDAESIQATQQLKSLKLCGEVLDMMDTNTTRIQKESKDLVDCLMKYASPMSVASCRIPDIIAAALQTLSCPIMKKHVRIETDGLDDLPVIQGDERKLYSVFYNLLNNALDAIQDEGTIHIRGEQSEGTVHLIVQDNGPGIPEQKLDSLFSHKPISQKTLGNSYGLRSIRNAVEDHGGIVKIASTVGVGTTIHVCLPADNSRTNSQGRPDVGNDF